MTVARTALVTGGGKNIGRAVCVDLATRGYNVVINGLSDRDACESVAQEVRAKGLRAAVVLGDLGEREGVAHITAKALAEFGGIDVFVGNAAIRPHTPFLEVTASEIHEVIATNLESSIYLLQAFIPHMVAQNWGRIVLLTGRHAIRGSTSVPVAIAKNGVWALAKTLAREFGGSGIVANAVSPGAITTPRVGELWSERYATAHKEIPTGRMGTCEEVAAVCGFLCSDAAAFTNGQMIAVNGGVDT